jgi:putative transposase
MFPEHKFTDEDIQKRYENFYGDERVFAAGWIPSLREKLSSLSEFIREIKVGFTRYYNKRHHRRGNFWGDRFKSVIVENGETLINCLAYIDLNPLRSGLVERPAEYRWNSLVYHIQTGNKDDFLSLDFGLIEFGLIDAQDRLKRYRRYVYEAGALNRLEKRQAPEEYAPLSQVNSTGQAQVINNDTLNNERKKNYEIGRIDRFRYRTRYMRRQAGKEDDVPALIDSGLSAMEFRRNWARLIQKVYETDPLICAKCQGEMKVISIIEDQAIIKKILQHLGIWETRLPRLTSHDQDLMR